jgi:hypothetical protein
VEGAANRNLPVLYMSPGALNCYWRPLVAHSLPDWFDISPGEASAGVDASYRPGELAVAIQPGTRLLHSQIKKCSRVSCC